MIHLRTLFFFFIGTSFLIAQKRTNIIVWEEGRQLKEADFKAVKGPAKLDRKGALTTYKIEILPKEVAVDEQDRILGYHRMTVVAFFYKNKSWLGSKKDPHLLAHEQLHFDIAELFARKIRKAFKKLKIQKIKTFNAYQTTYNKLWQECRAYQKRYDSETLNGTDYKVNKQWESDVQKALLDYQRYKYPTDN